ncbi:AbrB family transcriptional regulator [Corynebacterium sp.]|uniref:AbrB family transcriptional regulator n=1 Tax=Corynebacterium sp. TaxID=1720 RepID=UPI0026DB1AE2|nr:AbrB family transcriptional regulator [Corynebacterium sp.]MDO5032596.1 AbrB family transcriptional regulator [Corynebacterium sp.]
MSVRWLIVAPLSVAVGALFSYLHVPAAWILAAILVSGTMALATGKDLLVNKHFYGLSRGFIGVLAAIPLTTVPASTLLGVLPAAVTVSLITVLVGMSGGVLLHRSQPRDISWETGILSMLPGGASLMPALASELGADYRYVALTQYLRLLAISVSLPLVVSLLDAPSAHHLASSSAPTPWWAVGITVAIAVCGEWLGEKVHLPASAVLGPLILTVLVAQLLPGYSLEPIEPFKIMAFLSIGWVCGGGLSVPALKAFGKQLPATVLFIVVVVGVCALTALPLTAWLHISYFEAYLATTPGALETVLALSSEGGAGPAVVAVQIIRLIIVLVIAGYLPQILRAFRKRG